MQKSHELGEYVLRKRGGRRATGLGRSFGAGLIPR